MQKSLTLMALTLSLLGCGGGGSGGSGSGGDTSTPETPRYTASAPTTNGGRLIPAQLQLESGQSGQFRVEASSSHVLESISGCDGRIEGDIYTIPAISGDCSISVSFISHATKAIRDEDHTQASADELIDHARASRC